MGRFYWIRGNKRGIPSISMIHSQGALFSPILGAIKLWVTRFGFGRSSQFWCTWWIMHQLAFKESLSFLRVLLKKRKQGGERRRLCLCRREGENNHTLKIPCGHLLINMGSNSILHVFYPKTFLDWVQNPVSFPRNFHQNGKKSLFGLGVVFFPGTISYLMPVTVPIYLLLRTYSARLRSGCSILWCE